MNHELHYTLNHEEGEFVLACGESVNDHYSTRPARIPFLVESHSACGLKFHTIQKVRTYVHRGFYLVYTFMKKKLRVKTSLHVERERLFFFFYSGVSLSTHSFRKVFCLFSFASPGKRDLDDREKLHCIKR